jgi:N-acetyl sugar amidotransferase
MALLKSKEKDGIDWKQREKEFDKLVKWAKNKKAPFYDVLVPVSGGKDSITQIHRVLNKGVRILAVNVDYGIKTKIGKKNLELIPKMGVNLITIRPNLKLHKKLIKVGLEDYGDPDLLSHTMLHAYPLHIAMRFNIPLCILGENSAFEYGGDKNLAKLNHITKEWFLKYAANKGITAKVIAKKYNLPLNQLWQYDYPENFDKSDIKAVFSGYYFKWDSNEHLKIAKQYGFKELKTPREGTYRTFVGIDEKINRLHQYIKVLKFGYGRATDHACEDIRNGIITREEAKKLIKKYDLQPLGKNYIKDISKFLGYSEKEFLEILEKFRNRDIWKQDKNGNWYIPNYLKGCK